MQARPPGGEQTVAGGEEHRELAEADRLDHLDRRDLRVAAAMQPVVLLDDLDQMLQARGANPLARQSRLGRRDRQAGHAGAVLARRRERERAPAAADLEQVIVRARGRACRRCGGACGAARRRAARRVRRRRRTSTSSSRPASARTDRCRGRSGTGCSAARAAAPGGRRGGAVRSSPWPGAAAVPTAVSAFRNSSSISPGRSSEYHSPAWYDSPSPSLPRRASLWKRLSLTIVIRTGRPLPKLRTEPSGSSTSSSPPSRSRSARSRTRIAMRRSTVPRAAGTLRSRGCAAALTASPTRRPGRTAACDGTEPASRGA